MEWTKILERADLDENKLGMYKLMQVKVHGKVICVAHNQEGYFAVQNSCPHAGADLSQGWCEGGRIVCPVHRYTYDLKNGRGIGDQGDALRTYPLEVRDDGLYIGVKPAWSLFK